MPAAERDAEEQIVVFQVGKDVYGVSICHVQEIIATQSISRIPLAPERIKGVIDLRGKVIPVVDLRQCLGLSPGDSSKSTRIIVVRVKENTVGIVVDNASEVLRIPAEVVEPPSRVLTRNQTEYFGGIAKISGRLIGLLDLEKVLGPSISDNHATSASKGLVGAPT
ncbi:MAG: chemotaxis protein CheW [Chloroflexota bacterium]